MFGVGFISPSDDLADDDLTLVLGFDVSSAPVAFVRLLETWLRGVLLRPLDLVPPTFAVVSEGCL